MTSRHDAITTALAEIDKGQYGLRNHRWVRTVELAWNGCQWVEVYDAEVNWCFDCGTERSEAEQRQTPSDAYDDHPAVGFCGHTAKQPGQ